MQPDPSLGAIALEMGFRFFMSPGGLLIPTPFSEEPLVRLDDDRDVTFEKEVISPSLDEDEVAASFLDPRDEAFDRLRFV